MYIVHSAMMVLICLSDSILLISSIYYYFGLIFLQVAQQFWEQSLNIKRVHNTYVQCTWYDEGISLFIGLFILLLCSIYYFGHIFIVKSNIIFGNSLLKLNVYTCMLYMVR